MRKTCILILMLFALNALVAEAQEFAGANIISNPSFDTNINGWGNYFDYYWDPTNVLAASGTVSVVSQTGYTGKACKIAIVKAGTANYSVQISTSVPLEAGKKYSMKFKGSASSARIVALNLQQTVAPNTNWYTSANISLTTVPTVFGPYFFTPTTSDPAAAFGLYFGGSGDNTTAFIDDVEFAEMIPEGSTVAGAPTNVVAAGGSSNATVSFTAPVVTGGLNIKSYTVTSNPESITATGSASPVLVKGLTNGTSYTFTVTANNGAGSSVASAPSNAVTPGFKAGSYYVSGTGNDSNNGKSADTPFLTLTKAQDAAFAGDTVFLMNGTYPPFKITKSGNASYVITYKAYAGHKPVISCGTSGDWNLLLISASYITVDGIECKGINDQLTVAQGEANYQKIYDALYDNDESTSPDYQSTTNTNTNGITVGEDIIEVVHHVTVKNCKVHDCSAGGINATNADYVLFENNESFNNCWYTMWAPSGIGFIHLVGTDAGSNVIIRGNRVHNNYCSVKWISIKALSDGNGIIIDVTNGSDASGFPAYTGKILVENNVVYDNGGRGLYIISSQNAIFRNNTSYWNSKTPAYSDGGEMVVYDSHDITFVNNIGWANPAYSTNNYGIRDDGNWGTNSNITWKNNIAFNGTVGSPATFFNKTSTVSIDDSNKLGVDPLLVNPSIDPALADFRLKSNSPAINAGTSQFGVSEFDLAYGPRVDSETIDIGAYEFVIITGVSNEEEKRGDMLIYPNPSSGRFHLKVENEGSANVVIYNISGQPILNLQRFGTIDETVNVSNFQEGFYVVKIQNKAGVKTKKVVLFNH